MENNYNKLVNNLDKLNLLTMKNYLNQYIDLSNNNKVSLIDALYNLTSLELNAKKERSDRAVITTAHFPYIKRFEDFDFNFQPELNKAEVLDFKYLRFFDDYSNILFVGMPGVGKTHLATSIGIEAATNGRSTYFISCHELCLQLKRAQLENRLENRIKHFFSYSLLIIDEVGYLPMDIEASNLLFQLISKRYEKKSTIITSNKPLNKWREIFGDAVLLYDPNNKKIIDIIEDRKLESLDEYFYHIPLNELENVKYFKSDMYEGYRSVKKRFFNNATHIVDGFHFSRYVTGALNSIRINVMNSLDKSTPEYRTYKDFKALSIRTITSISG